MKLLVTEEKKEVFIDVAFSYIEKVVDQKEFVVGKEVLVHGVGYAMILAVGYAIDVSKMREFRTQEPDPKNYNNVLACNKRINPTFQVGVAEV